MAEQLKRKKSFRVSFFFFLFGLSFLIGIISVFLWKDELMYHDTFLRVQLLEGLQGLEIDYSKMLYLCLQNRLVKIIVLMILAYTNLGNIVLCVVTSWMGSFAGMLLELLSLRYGIKGIFLFLAGIMPQFLFYTIAYVGILVMKQNIENQYLEQYYERKKKSRMKQGVQIIFIFMIFLIGIIMEVYVNPLLILQVLEYF